MPLIRYHTGDITYFVDEACNCGRTCIKLHRFLGRADDMLVVRGINVFPSQIEDVLLKIPEIGDYFQVIVDRERHKLDEIAIKVEVTDEAFTGELEDLARIQKMVVSKLKSVMKVRSKIELVEKGPLPGDGRVRTESGAGRRLTTRDPAHGDPPRPRRRDRRSFVTTQVC